MRRPCGIWFSLQCLIPDVGLSKLIALVYRYRYSTGFLEDRAEGQSQNRSTQYQAPAPAASASNFYTERISPERAALLPKVLHMKIDTLVNLRAVS